MNEPEEEVVETDDTSEETTEEGSALDSVMEKLGVVDDSEDFAHETETDEETTEADDNPAEEEVVDDDSGDEEEGEEDDWSEDEINHLADRAQALGLRQSDLDRFNELEDLEWYCDQQERLQSQQPVEQEQQEQQEAEPRELPDVYGIGALDDFEDLDPKFKEIWNERGRAMGEHMESRLEAIESHFQQQALDNTISTFQSEVNALDMGDLFGEGVDSLNPSSDAYHNRDQLLTEAFMRGKMLEDQGVDPGSPKDLIKWALQATFHEQLGKQKSAELSQKVRTRNRSATVRPTAHQTKQKKTGEEAALDSIGDILTRVGMPVD